MEDDDDSTYLSTTSGLPELTFKESRKAAIAALKVVVDFAIKNGMNATEAKKLYNYCIGDEFQDRTIRLTLPDFGTITTRPFIEMLQREFLNRWTLWRVLIHGEIRATCVFVYPTDVWFEGVDASRWWTGLPHLIAKDRDLTAPREDPRRRQLSRLARIVNVEIGQIEINQIRLLSVFR